MIQILIADDEQDTREGLKNLIPWTELGIDSVFTASDGLEAVKLSMQVHPDIILSDIRMPKLNGIEFLEQVKSSMPDCKIIFLSAYSDKEYLKSAIRFKAVRYIEKPIDLEEIKEAAKEAINEIRVKQDMQKMVRLLETHEEEVPQGTQGVDPSFIKDALKTGKYNITRIITEYIEKHYMENDLNIMKIANETHISPAHISHIFKRSTGITVNTYITRYRIDKAKVLLSTSEIKLAEIADNIGFRDQNYFTKVFKKAAGLTPSQYREQYNG